MPVSLGEDIRWIFGGFILAFVVAELAKALGATFLHAKAEDRGPRLAHLGYTLAVIVMSFWGWSIAIKGGLYAELRQNASLFQYSNWLFLVDIGIFMTYYVLLVGIEHAGMPAAKWALRCTVAVFAGYLVWDLIVALRQIDSSTSWRHVAASAFCAAFASVAAWRLRKARNVQKAIYGSYVALFLLMLAFRFMTVTIHASTPMDVGIFRGLWILCVIASGMLVYFARTAR